MNKPDMTIKQVETPDNRRCASGHIAPEKFKVEEDGYPEPTRFFQVIGNEISGIYCELCLIVANHFAKENKKRRI
jgi:hypothetical protein